MLFKEILDVKYRALYSEFEKLYTLIIQNQTHEGDLLLVKLNAFYNPEVKTWNNVQEKMSPYMFGPNHEGHSEITHHDFIGHYVEHNMSKISLKDHLNSVVYAAERKKEIDRLNFEETISIQTEMLIYLKIWESDVFIKKFYQLTNLLQGLPYDWHYDLTKTPTENGTTASRSKILREKIRNKFLEPIPELYQSFKIAYTPQVRNAIAHSQYSILGMDIPLYSTPRFRYKVHHLFRSKVHQYSAGKVTNYSAAKYTTLLKE